MTDLEVRSIFANAPVEKSIVEVVEITAPWFSKSYYLQAVDVDGFTVDGNFVEYVPMSIGKSSNNEDLNDSRRITISMVNDIIGEEMSKYDPTTDVKPSLITRSYVRYSDGTFSGMKGVPVVLSLNTVTSDENSSTFDVSSKPVNNSYTGEIITKERFETLRGVS